MCNVKILDDEKRKVTVILKDGSYISSDWFDDEKVTAENEVNCSIKEKETLYNIMDNNGLSEDDVDKWFLSRKRDNKTVYISDHAIDRFKERNKWNKKTALRMVKKIYDNGKRQKDINGCLLSWIEYKMSLYEDKTDEFVLYGDIVYIFNQRTLVTLYPIPKLSSIRRMFCQAY